MIMAMPVCLMPATATIQDIVRWGVLVFCKCFVYMTNASILRQHMPVVQESKESYKGNGGSLYTAYVFGGFFTGTVCSPDAKLLCS